MVSLLYFHQMVGFLQDPGTFDEFMDKFLEGKIIFGKWTNHVKSWRQAELGDRIMFITYEEMVQVKLKSEDSKIWLFQVHEGQHHVQFKSCPSETVGHQQISVP